MRCRDEFSFPEWQPEYEAVLLETDQHRRHECLHAAEIAIVKRLQALKASSDGHVERAAIADAIETLRRIQIETMGYPAWKNSTQPE